MSVLPVGIGSSGGYTISRSVRLRSSASAYFNRTFTTPTNNKIYTWNQWVKRGELTAGTLYVLASCPTAGFLSFGDGTNQVIRWNDGTADLISTPLYRDPSAWYMITVAVDTTQATSSNRVKIYVNGVQVTAFSTAGYPSLNASQNWNSAGVHNIGRRVSTSTLYYDGYLTEINFIDGQALTPSSFGETDAVTGVWKPKKYAGTYGTNGFYLNFSDPSAATAAAIGKDNSGNGNNWTPNNISVTAGVTYDSMIDSPTPYADGGNGRGNYAVLNPLWKGANITPTNGNLTNPLSSGSPNVAMSTMPMSTGKWYAEMTNTAAYGSVGLCIIAANLTAPTFTIGVTAQTGLWELYDNGTGVYRTSDGGAFSGSLGASRFLSAGTIQFAYDADLGYFWIGRNNTWYDSTLGTTGDPSTGANPTFTITASRGPFNIGAGSNSATNAQNWNFGQQPFAYTPPTGFKALNTQNLPDATIKKGSQYFDATLWSGDGTSGRVITTNVETVDFAWVKKRNGIDDHRLANSVLGGNKHLKSNATDAESTGTTVIQAFSGSTFTVGSDNSVNASGGTYAGWTWKESVSAGFDIVTYTGTGANRTISHSLGATPKMIIIKNRSQVSSWIVGHQNMAASTPWAGFLVMNTTAAYTTASGSLIWNSTAPTDTVFSVGTDTATNFNGNNFVAYLFSEVAGYSKFGSYTGNGAADGPFVYCGFRPRFILLKAIGSTSAGNWYIYDTARETYNQEITPLWPNITTAEAANTVYAIDVLSNGFKIRTSASSINPASSETAIFAAFAENPFKNSLAR